MYICAFFSLLPFSCSLFSLEGRTLFFTLFLVLITRACAWHTPWCCILESLLWIFSQSQIGAKSMFNFFRRWCYVSIGSSSKIPNLRYRQSCEGTWDEALVGQAFWGLFSIAYQILRLHLQTVWYRHQITWDKSSKNKKRSRKKRFETIKNYSTFVMRCHNTATMI